MDGKPKDPKRLQEEKQMMEQMEEKDKAEAEEDKKEQQQIAKTNFLKKLSPYNKPCINNITGLLGSMVQGACMPAFGCFITKMLFALMMGEDGSVHGRELMKINSRGWALFMFLTGVASFCAVFVQRFSFGIIGENITKNIRWRLYF